MTDFEQISRLYETVQKEQRAEHRTLFCRPECVDRLRAQVAAEGMTPWVSVVANELVDDGVVLVARTPLDENGEPRLAWRGDLR